MDTTDILNQSAGMAWDSVRSSLMWCLALSDLSRGLRKTSEVTFVTGKFEDTVKNLPNMKPNPHDEALAKSKCQSSDDQSSSKAASRLRNSGED